MESVEFYAQLLFIAKQIGGPKELSDAQVQRLYEIRRQFGMTGKHPADLCSEINKDGKSCHGCKGHTNSTSGSDTDALVSDIAKKVIEQLGLK